MDTVNHEEFSRRYQDEKELLVKKINIKKKRIKKTVTIIIISMIIEMILMIYGFSFYILILGTTCAYLIIASIIMLFGCKRQFDKCNSEYRIGLSKVIDRLEKEDLFDYTGQSELSIIITEDNSKRKKTKIIISIVLVSIYFLGIGLQLLCTFNPDDWQTKPWKRKYMLSSLMNQQDWDAAGNFAKPYNVKFMTKDEIEKMLIVPEADGVTIDIDIQIKQDFEVFYVYTNRKGENVWIVAKQTYVGDYYLTKCKSGYYEIETYN